jgi:hypothetical protein
VDNSEPKLKDSHTIAIDTLREIAQDGDQSAETRVEASKLLLECY